MQKLEQITPEGMSPIVRAASESEEQDREAAQARAESFAQATRLRRMRTGLLAAFLTVWGLVIGWMILYPAIPPATTYTLVHSAQHPWQLDTNAGTLASVTYENSAAVIHIDKFVRPPGGIYWVNYNSQFKLRSLAGYKYISFNVHGSGLTKLQLYLVGSATERWRSPVVVIKGGAAPEGSMRRLDLRNFDLQQEIGGQWKSVGKSAPGNIQKFSFKLGDYMNDVNAHGEVAISDLKLEPE